MKHDRMQKEVRFSMGEHGFVLDVGGYAGSMGTIYAFSTIAEVADWFLDQYAPASGMETRRAETAGLGGEAMTARPDAQTSSETDHD